MKSACALIIGLGLVAATGFCQNTGPNMGTPPICGPHTTDTKCVSAPEPSVVPEFLLCLGVTASGILLWRWNRKSLKRNLLPR
jgi:hypothetical protein